MGISAGGAYEGFHYKTQIASCLDSKAKMMRLAQEAASISSSLPLSTSSSVFVRIDESRMDVWRALIIGPEGTPYENGCFQFDVFFPQTYPKTPPLVNLETTGAGSVRFNPNLYNCGKVCLSLLGTWEGDRSEMWNEQGSTFLQVLVSIQSLILVPVPWANEPGQESSLGTPEGDRMSAEYNAHIKAETIRVAILGQLKNPAVGFEDVIRAHCWLKRSQILATAKQWRATMPARSPDATALDASIAELDKFFAGMTEPEVVAAARQ
eukprot:Amastigsp_a344630_31.p2 type:complete len:266 gc:universal Amastigsp_a344630_31:1-798(+)